MIKINDSWLSGALPHILGYWHNYKTTKDIGVLSNKCRRKMAITVKLFIFLHMTENKTLFSKHKFYLEYDLIYQQKRHLK